MSEVLGFTTQIKISGAAVAMVGEATTQDATQKKYQITDAAKRVLDRAATIRVHKKGTNDAAEVGTTTTTIKMTAHGLKVGDLICNTTRGSAYRLVLTKLSADMFTVGAVTSQASGDTIEVYPTEDEADYSLNRLNGTVTYGSATTRVIKISGDYLPMTTAAYANQMSRADVCDMLEITKFGDTYKKRLPGLKSASGTLTGFYEADEIYGDALEAGLPIVIEDRTVSTDEPNRYWALLDSDEVSAAVEGVQGQIVSWVSYDSWIKLGV